MKSALALAATFVLFTAAQACAWQQENEMTLWAMQADGSQCWEVMVFEDLGFLGSPDISPDGTKLAADGWKAGQKTQDAHLLIVDLNSGEVKDLGPGAMPTWSPDGKLLAYSDYNGGVRIRSVEGQDNKQIDAGGWGIQWSPDGRTLAYTRSGNLILFDVLTEAKKEVFLQGENPYRHYYWNGNWSPDSKKFCVKALKGQDELELVVVTLDGDKPTVQSLGKANDHLEDVAWSGDGTRVMAANNKGRLLVYRVDGSEPVQELKGQPAEGQNGNLTWTRDGKLLLFTNSKPKAK